MKVAIVRRIGLASCIGACACKPDAQVRWFGTGMTPPRWDKAELLVEVVTPDPTVGLSRAEVVEMCQQIANEWTVGLPVQVRVVPRPERDLSDAFREDGRNVLFFATEDEQERHSWPVRRGLTKGQYAATTPYLVDETRRIAEADIEINARDFRWDGVQNRERLQAVLTHELGHFLGLEHPCGPPTFASQKPTDLRPCKDTSRAERALATYPDPLEAGRVLVLKPTRVERDALAAAYRD